MSKILRKLTATGTAEFATAAPRSARPQCSVEAAYSKARAQAAYQLPVIR